MGLFNWGRNKLKVPENARSTKFKSGDLVQYIGGGIDVGGYKLKHGQVFEVETIANGFWLRLKGLWDFPVNPDNFINWEKHEEVFRIGDYVECQHLADIDRGRGVLVGEVYKVEYVGETYLGFEGISGAFKQECFMRVPERYYFEKIKEKTMRVNNLAKHIGNSAAVEYAIKSGDTPMRCTGRTTGLAFEYIAKAYKNPNQWITVRDHCVTYNSDRTLLKHIEYILDKLEFELFEFDYNRGIFRFNLWGEETQSEDFVVIGGRKFKLVEV